MFEQLLSAPWRPSQSIFPRDKLSTCFKLAVFLLFTTPLRWQEPAKTNSTLFSHQFQSRVDSRRGTRVSIPHFMDTDELAQSMNRDSLALPDTQRIPILWTSFEKKSAVEMALRLGLGGKEIVEKENVSTPRPECMWVDCENITVLLDSESRGKQTVTVWRAITPVKEEGSEDFSYIYAITFGVKIWE